MRRGRRRAAMVIMGLLAGLVAPLLLAEGAARLAHDLGRYQPKIITEPYLARNPYLYQVLTPGSYTRPGGARIEVNSLGFRGPEFFPKKPPGVYRIFVLGGSTSFGYPESIRSTADTYPFRLQAELRSRLGSAAVEVINAGVIGYTLRTSLVNFATRLTWYEPDLIIVYHAVNDAIAIREEDDLFHAVGRGDPGPSLWERIRDGSYVLLELNFRLFKRFAHPVARGITPSDDPRPATLAAYERHLKTLVDMARAMGVGVVIGNESVAIPEACDEGRVTAPADQALRPIEGRVCFLMQWYFPHLTPLGIRRTFDGLGAIQRRVAQEAGIPWVDMNSVVPRTAEYYWDLCHTRPAASAIIARAFAGPVVSLIRARQ